MVSYFQNNKRREEKNKLIGVLLTLFNGIVVVSSKSR